MLTTNFLKTRTSTRDFKDEKVDDEKIKKIYQITRELENKFGEKDLHYQVNNKGEEVYFKLKGNAGYKGVMIKAPLYVALDITNDSKSALVKGAYGLEELITKLSELGLASCYITVSGVSDDILKSAFVNLYLEDYKDEANLVDAGIVMYYFDQLTKEISINSIWEVEPKLDGSKYQFIAQKEL
ncbi:MAG: nitroreductase family protein [Anaerococcus vaginalis]|nr:nitroreductase family protein [Anaerococcus vaginalis]